MIISILCILGYAFIAGLVGGRHNAISSADCKYRDGHEATDRYGTTTTQTCFKPYWCSHLLLTYFFFGPFWFIALPIAGGVLIGSRDKETRTKRRRARELDEANHRLELARIAREEDAELTLQLEHQRARR